MTSTTYNEMYIEMARDLQKRITKSTENFGMAAERRKQAVEKGSHEELTSQAQVQEAVNADLERLNVAMKELVERVKENDSTPLPIPIKYSCFNEDNIGIRFQEQNKEKDTFEILTRVTKIFNRTVRAEVRDMRKSSVRERKEMAANYVMNFEGSKIIKFMTADDFYAARAAFIGKTGVSSCYGNVNGAGIQDIKKSDKKGIVIRMANNDIQIQEPIAVACDLGAIWKMSSGSFEWFWYAKKDA
jgi:hypothetical protein